MAKKIAQGRVNSPPRIEAGSRRLKNRIYSTCDFYLKRLELDDNVIDVEVARLRDGLRQRREVQWSRGRGQRRVERLSGEVHQATQILSTDQWI